MFSCREQVGESEALEDGDDHISNSSHGLRSAAGSGPALVFAKGDIADTEKSVFYAPVLPGKCQQECSAGFFRR